MDKLNEKVTEFKCEKFDLYCKQKIEKTWQVDPEDKLT